MGSSVIVTYCYIFKSTIIKTKNEFLPISNRIAIVKNDFNKSNIRSNFVNNIFYMGGRDAFLPDF